MADWRLAGFTELRALGEGGFGRVVLARHDASGQLVAIKYLFPRFAVDPELRAQFRHEATILRLVVSPHVARLFEFVESDAGAAIVMEAVPGVPLRDILAQETVLTPESALAILKGSLLGLAAAHTAGTVHRDYKPGNVLVQPDHQSKLVDFGIAVLAGHSGLASGTPAYMAPEQWQGGPATPATDVYAATCVFFQCVTGHRPYEAADTERLRDLHLTADTPAGEVPEAVRPLVIAGMAKDPNTRPASAAAFVGALEAVAYAGYGPDWERRGWQRLAGHAGTLLALSPLAFLAPTTVGTLAAGGGAAVTAGGAAGSAATGGVLSAATAKLAVLVIGIGVVAGATAIVATNTGDSPTSVATSSPAPRVALQIDQETRTETTGAFSFAGQYVRVSGLGDPALEQRVNAALVAPVDEWFDFMTDATGGPPAPSPAEAKVTATVRISGPNVISVDYVRTAGDGGYYFGASGTGGITAVAIDLATGEPLSLTGVFPGADTADGAAELAARVRDANPRGLCGDQTVDGVTPLALTPESFTDAYSTSGDPLAAVVLTEDGAEFVIVASEFGYPRACDFSRSPVPYDVLTDLMSPEAVKLLTV